MGGGRREVHGRDSTRERIRSPLFVICLFEFGYRLPIKTRFSISSGLSVAKEWNRYVRPFDHILAGGPHDYVFRFLESYHYTLVGMNLEPQFRFYEKGNSGFLMGCSLVGSSKILSYYVQETRTDVLEKSDFFSVEINPLIGYSYKRYEATFFYRFWQNKKVDRVIHRSAYFNGRSVLKEDFEHFNPTKIGVSLKWMFNFRRKN